MTVVVLGGMDGGFGLDGTWGDRIDIKGETRGDGQGRGWGEEQAFGAPSE